MRQLLFVVVLILAGLVWQFSAGADANTPSLINSALTVLTGDDSHISKTAFRRVGSTLEWKKTWLSHLGLKEDTIHRTAMEVDFDRCMVIAMFGGKSENRRGYRVESVLEKKDSIVVQFDQISFQTAGPDGGAVHVMPYAFIVLAKSEKPVVLEENVQIYKDHAPEWKEVARLSASSR
jgi:hypothetical protein